MTNVVKIFMRPEQLGHITPKPSQPHIPGSKPERLGNIVRFERSAMSSGQPSPALRGSDYQA
ncbi:MAG: hypothetical protein CME13_04155 [Gemmatimonadetes bacterium]|nr:hypothetical protein [Gemmatimonadota bacterium]